MSRKDKQDLLALLRGQVECEQNSITRNEDHIAVLKESNRRRAGRIIEINKEIETLMRSK